MINILKIFKKEDNNTQNQAPTIVKKKVLIVEDDQFLSNVYRDILAKNNFEVAVAFNGQEGLSKIIEFVPDLIVLDLTMPVMDGKKMLNIFEKEQVYAQYRKIPILVLTNEGSADNMRETKTLGGAKEFLIKANTTPEQLLESVKQYLSVTS